MLYIRITYVFMYLCYVLHMYIYIYIYMYLYMYSFIYVYITHVCIYLYIYTHIHTYILICIKAASCLLYVFWDVQQRVSALSAGVHWSGLDFKKGTDWQFLTVVRLFCFFLGDPRSFSWGSVRTYFIRDTSSRVYQRHLQVGYFWN